MNNYALTPRGHATSLAFQRDFYFCFFGETDTHSWQNSTSTPSLPDNTQQGSDNLQSEQLSAADTPRPHTPEPPSEWEGFSPLNEGINNSRSLSFQTHSIATESSLGPREELVPQGRGPYSTLLGPLGPCQRPSDVLKDLISDIDTILLYVWNSMEIARFSITNSHH